MRISTQCRACGLPFRERIEPGQSLECPNCATQIAVAQDTWSGDRLEACALCGCEHLYRQRDFNRSLGCLLVVIGAILVPWTYGLSLGVLALVDFWLYRRLSDSVVCYRCDTVFRDARPTDRQGEVDLLKHDVVKYGKTWQDVSPQAGAGGDPVTIADARNLATAQATDRPDRDPAGPSTAEG